MKIQSIDMRQLAYEQWGPQDPDAEGATAVRLQTFDKLEEVTPSALMPPSYIKVFDLASDHSLNPIDFLTSLEDLELHREGQERSAAWNPDAAEGKPVAAQDKTPLPMDAIDPPHYQGYMKHGLEELQWLEAMNRLSRYANHPEVFIGAVELQIRKYLDRNGRKDHSDQELAKAEWYLRYLRAYIKVGCKPILVEEIDTILGD